MVAHTPIGSRCVYANPLGILNDLPSILSAQPAKYLKHSIALATFMYFDSLNRTPASRASIVASSSASRSTRSASLSKRACRALP